MSTKDKINKVILWTSFIIYFLLVLYVTLFGSRASGFNFRMVNLIPFKTIKLYLKWLFDNNRANNYIPIVNLGVNFILLMPMGYYLPEVFRIFKNFFLYTAVCALFVGFIELIQYFTLRGSFDVDDFILNMMGALIGYVLWAVFYGIRKRKTQESESD